MPRPLAIDWFVVEVRWLGTALPHYHLSGIATGHELIPDGHRFISTPLRWLDRTNQQARSRNTLYRLGPEIVAGDVRALDMQRINEYLEGLWNPPSWIRLVLTIPHSLEVQKGT